MKFTVVNTNELEHVNYEKINFYHILLGIRG